MTIFGDQSCKSQLNSGTKSTHLIWNKDQKHYKKLKQGPKLQMSTKLRAQKYSFNLEQGPKTLQEAQVRTKVARESFLGLDLQKKL